MQKALVLGAGGFIGSHLVEHLVSRGFWVCGVDLKHPEFRETTADEFVVGDLRDPIFCRTIFEKNTFQEVYQLAADMGGAGFVFTGDNDASIMSNSASININVLECLKAACDTKIFYSSSACIYPAHNQQSAANPICTEGSAYPAAPDSEYGWEKLFSERLFLSYARNYGLQVRIARYHNIFGPKGTWTGGREKAPAALCRKVAAASEGSSIELWGSGQQTRSFLFVDECIEGTFKLMHSDFEGPVNIGSEEMITISDLADRIIRISGKHLTKSFIDGPVGVTGRNSDNRLIQDKLGWAPSQSLHEGLVKTYSWVSQQVLESTELI